MTSVSVSAGHIILTPTQKRSKVIIVVTPQDLEAKKKKRSPDLYSSFSLSRFLFPLAMWC